MNALIPLRKEDLIVTLDGNPVSHLTEFNIYEGWVRKVAQNPDGSIRYSNGNPVIEQLRGDVQLYAPFKATEYWLKPDTEGGPSDQVPQVKVMLHQMLDRALDEPQNYEVHVQQTRPYKTICEGPDQPSRFEPMGTTTTVIVIVKKDQQ